MSAVLRIFRGGGAPAAAPEDGSTFARVPVEALRDPELSDAAVRILGGLMAGLWSDAQAASVTREQLAGELGRSVSSIERGIRELEARGYLERDRDRSKMGAPHRLVLLFRLKSRSIQPVRSEGLQPVGSDGVTLQLRRGDPSEVTGCNPSEVTGSSYRENSKREKSETDAEAESSATRPTVAASPPPPSVGEIEELVGRCRLKDAAGMLARLALVQLLAEGVDVAGVAVDPAELGRWVSEVSGRRAAARAPGSGQVAAGGVGGRRAGPAPGRLAKADPGPVVVPGAASGASGAEGGRTLNLSIANAALLALEQPGGES